ncbi:sensor histidine kinase [Methylophaga sp. OBS3]|uniref:sensor histidine kinase n=1 Tax=Methylophaga sp. OBS3 TaxID=2991934 RepID=UPI00224F2FAB|nr:sensor histidine kinase [Methylophaga sp. OBS3]MCX4189123.1 sensor histidine kinase [Methylophaga sp. OBS3]
MNLKLQLFARILLIALFSVLISAAYVLYETNQQSMFQADSTAKRINQHMTEELLRNYTRYDYRTPFPSTRLWEDMNGLPGSCIQFLSRSESRRRSMCSEVDESERSWPLWFGGLYSSLFSPDYEATRRFSFNAVTYGTILVSLNRHVETARAWHNLRAVLGVLSFSIVALSFFIFMTINRLLRPATLIVSGLEKMRDGHLETRIPTFDIAEWRRTSQAINALATSQQQVLAENQQLAMKLMNVQEEEHRYIARELHDEFGQCLAGINAMTTSISQTAKNDNPEIQPELDSINRITEHMMVTLRNLLTRLRPTEVDEIGLEKSLQKLIKSWHQRRGNETQITLLIDTPLQDLPAPLPVNIYRVVQEALTNIAKHAQATKALIHLFSPETGFLQLMIEDNGLADNDKIQQSMGMGLLGINERVRALGGQVNISANQGNGLKMMIRLPIHTQKEFD